MLARYSVASLASTLAVRRATRRTVALSRHVTRSAGVGQRQALLAIVATRACSSAAAAAAPGEAPKTAPLEKFRKDYRQPNYWIREVQLDVKIFEGRTQVEATLSCELNASVSSKGDPLILDGEDLTLKSVGLVHADGQFEALTEGPDGYQLTEEGMTVTGLQNSTTFKLRTKVEITPEKNTQLSGLYYSGCMYCTQMEAEGFRRFTYFPDRPDVMAKYTSVRVEASRDKCPVLLGNGNKIAEGVCADDSSRHFAVFQDPFAKPSYLFAIVAGKLESITSTFKTASGRTISLGLFSEPQSVNQLDHAMESLKNAMRWDEETYGLEYDLDEYNIVAVSDFNMGAMENKGLNIFNTALVLARPDTATDSDFERIEGVIGHEYFHNWTGNRVTCRDWFQLTLKEGLTVFRDQEFSGDMGSKSVKRIEEVRILRAAQFPEDGGPMAHPIRPESYIAMDNFYTATVYCKGAEVIRMYQTLLGVDGFKKGLDLYFKRHDGSAVTCDDFRAAMADANGRDLTQFEEWYLQPGTPQVEVRSSWDSSAGNYRLILKQKVGAGQAHLPKDKRREKPMHIPVVIGLFDRDSGREVLPSQVLELTQEEQSFDFKLEGLSNPPVPSLFRDFSAPVKVDYPYSDDELAFLAGHDTDAFNRWEAAQELGSKTVRQVYAQITSSSTEDFKLPKGYLEAMRAILNDEETADRSLLAYALVLPSQTTLLETLPRPVDPLKLHEARCLVRKSLATELREDFLKKYKALSPAPTEAVVIDGENAGKRRLRNTCLAYLCALKDDEVLSLALSQFEEARTRQCMTDKLAALQCLVERPEIADAQKASQQFYDDHSSDALVVDKWFAAQAGADLPDILQHVERLVDRPDFTRNPNRIRAAISTFVANPRGFHKEDGSGYAFIAKKVAEVDSFNPQLGSRLALSFSSWPKLNEGRQALMKEHLGKLHATKETLSKDTFEVIDKVFKAA
mmetsp:Transcript_88338/g.184603  ORF Transcript_88338/g.184603 Transcript_88338/m.184603 type:complete len:964 (-) Transcript_88338:158-3049(-)